MRTIAALALILAACGTDPQGDDTSVDAVPHAGMTIDVQCQDFTRLVRAADGSQGRATYRYAIVPSVAPGSSYLVSLCGETRTVLPAQPACPPGATCTGTSGPEGAVCVEVYRHGTFVDGKLRVSCGWKLESFATNGSLINSDELRYTSVKVTTF